MKYVATFLCAVALAVPSFVGAASPVEADAHPDRVLPVRVAVDANGVVTDLDPAINLRPEQRRSLAKMVGDMIAGPARDKRGRGKSSQFVMYFGIENGDETGGLQRLVYLTSKPALTGPLHWTRYRRGREYRYALAPPASGPMLRSDANLGRVDPQRFSGGTSDDSGGSGDSGN